VRAQAAGARGYILKTAEGKDLLRAIREIHEGRRHFPRATRLDPGLLDRPRVQRRR
jgi:DNA-binding NarL/FixJ family response regulator